MNYDTHHGSSELGHAHPGVVYWFTGLSGAGKTTVGSLFCQLLRERKKNVVYLDGDVLREVFSGSHGHTSEKRKNLAMHYSRLCRMLADQGMDVVIATISMYHDVRQWNRENIEHYQEIYLKVPMEVLLKRDQKGLYSRAIRGEIKNIIGLDIEMEEPKCPDHIIVNNGRTSPTEITEALWNSISPVLEDIYALCGPQLHVQCYACLSAGLR